MVFDPKVFKAAQNYSVKYYGGWGDSTGSDLKANAADQTANLKKIKQLLKKQSKKMREDMMELLKKEYYLIGETLLPEEIAFKAKKDGYLRKWAKDLGLSE